MSAAHTLYLTIPLIDNLQSYTTFDFAGNRSCVISLDFLLNYLEVFVILVINEFNFILQRPHVTLQSWKLINLQIINYVRNAFNFVVA